MIKPIETVYNGYKFRSRLEARWAVFFDALGVKYEYEKEGFDLGKTGWYLPDFWLPELKLFCEVKGVRPSLDEFEKCLHLSIGLGAAVLLAWGEIDYDNDAGFSFIPTVESNKCVFFNSAYLTICPICKGIALQSVLRRNLEGAIYDGQGPSISSAMHLYCNQCAEVLCQQDIVYANPANTKHAYKEARQARFEYGETPRIT